MINTSNEYKEVIRKSGKKQYAGVTVTLSDGTILTLDNSNILENGLSINDSTSTDNNFQIGSAIINQLTLIIANFDGKYNQYDFTDAIMRPTTGLQLSGTVETLHKGVFTVDEANASGGTIVITALDNMNKFDTDFSEVTATFPITAFNLLYAVCLHCGVSLATTTFFNSDFSIATRPDDEATTCREIVAWIAQLSGNFARCNTDGALELKWYDFGVFENADNIDGGTFDSSNPYASGDNVDGGDFTFSETTNYNGGTFLDMNRYHHIYSLGNATIGTDDVVITGIRVKAMGIDSDYGETVLFGSEGYVIEISDNPLIQENTAATIANSIGAKIVGMKFRTCSVQALTDPSIEAGDVAYLSHKNNSYQILITGIDYTIGKLQSIVCGAETPSKNSSKRYPPETKTIVEARKMVKAEKTARELAIAQLATILENSSGLYMTKVQQPDGSYIYYMHDKQTLSESAVVWKLTANALGISTDGGITYPYGLDATGAAILSRIYTIGLDATYVNTGILASQNGASTINLNNGTFSLGNAHFVWDGTSFKVIGDVTANSGKIGPWTINTNGMASITYQFIDDPNGPILWLNNILGTTHANYQPDLAFVSTEDANGIIHEAYMDSSEGDRGLRLDGYHVVPGGLIVDYRTSYTRNGIQVDVIEGSSDATTVFIINAFGKMIALSEDGIQISSFNGGNISVYCGDVSINMSTSAGTCAILAPNGFTYNGNPVTTH